MNNFLAPVLFLVVGTTFGSWFGWHLHENKYANEQQAILENIETNLPANASFRANLLAGMTESVEDGELEIFYNVACELIKSELSEIDEFLESSPINGKGFNERVAKVKSRLIELESTNRC